MIRGSGFTLTDELGNSLRIPFSIRDTWMEEEKSEAVTSGGLLREQSAGARIVISEGGIRRTQAEFNALMTFMLRQTALYRYYESDERPDYIPLTDWPLSVSIRTPKKDKQVGGGPGVGIVYYLTLEMRSVRLFTVT